MRLLRVVASIVILAPTAQGALTSVVHDSRRAFLQRTIATTIVGGLSGGVPSANAAYTREVGGATKSAEQAAYNIQVCYISAACVLENSPLQCHQIHN